MDEHMKLKQIYPRILIATSGSVGAGLDSTAINLVYRIGCPGSVFEFIQEMGRCGRVLVHGNPVNSNKYSIHISLEDYIYMYKRIHAAKDRQDGLLTISEQNKMQEKYLLSVLRLLVLKRVCYHKALEMWQANVTIDNDGPSNCDNACPRCNKEDETMFLRINKQNVKKALVDIFIRDGECYMTPMQLCKKLQEIKQYHSKLFNKTNKKHVLIYHVKGLILQLLATGIISLKVKREVDDETLSIFCALGMDDDLNPSYTVQASWAGIDCT